MLTADDRRVCECVDRDRLVQTCCDLVRTPTVNPYSGDAAPSGEAAGQDMVAAALRSAGADVELVPCIDRVLAAHDVLAPEQRVTAGRPNVIGCLTFGDGTGPTLVLDAHMDTIAVDHYQGDPFSGHVAEGFVHGRGSSDDKGGVSVMLEAARAVRDSGVCCSGTLVCCSVVEEECDGAGRGSLTCIRHLPRPDAAIVIDGSAGGIFSGCTGVVTAEVTVRGRAGHAALGSSVNAIEKAVTLLPAFSRFRELRGGQPGEFNLGTFHSGGHPANVPNEAVLGLNIKTSLDDMAAAEARYGARSGRTVRELFERCLADAAHGDTFLAEHPPVVRWVKDVPAASCGVLSDAFITLGSTAFADVTETAPTVSLLAGWGDISHFANAGIPCFGMGAGFPGAAHSASEKVAIDDLERAARALTLIIFRTLQRAPCEPEHQQ